MKNTANHIGIGVEDVNDILEQITKKLNVRFEKDDLINVTTFGELCDIILSKINLSQKDDCTSQQAFYKLRKAILEHKSINKVDIKLETTLEELFANDAPIKIIRNIENSLGFKLNILQIKRSAILIILIGLTTALVGIFINVMYGLIITAVILIYIAFTANKIKEFKVTTIRDVVKIMKQDNYFKSRRTQNTVNRKEIVKFLENYFIDNLATDLKGINRDTVLI